MLGRFGRSSSRDLHDRADHHERPVGPHRRDLVEQLGIEPLVDHAIEAEARPRQVFLVGGIELARARLAEMGAVDRRGEAVDVVVAVLLRLVEARSAGEDDVGAVDQLLLELEQFHGRELELRKLVHRVEHGDVGIEMAREGQHHRRIVPGDQRAADRRDMSVQQALQRRFARVLRHAFRQVRNDDPDVGRVLRLANLEVGRFLRADVDRLFPVDDVHLAGEAAHQMLRPLEHEVPPQVRKAQQGCGFRIRRRGLGFEFHWHPDARQHFRRSSD